MAPVALMPAVPPDEPIVAPLLTSQLRSLRGKLRHAFGMTGDDGAANEAELGQSAFAEPGSHWEALKRVSEGIGGPEQLRAEGGGLRQASARWQRWLHEEIDAAARAGLPPPMTVSGATPRPHGAAGSGWILPPSLLPAHEERSPHYAAGATSSGASGPPQWSHRRGQPDGQPRTPALSGEVVVIRGSGSPIGRQAALSSAEHGAILLLVDTALTPHVGSAGTPSAHQQQSDGGEEDVRRIWVEQAQLRQAQAARVAGEQLVHEVRTRYGHIGADAVYVQLAAPIAREGSVGVGQVGLDEKATAWNCSVERLVL